MTANLDGAVHAHLARMPDSTRRLLEPRIARIPYAEIRRHAEAPLDEDHARLSASV